MTRSRDLYNKNLSAYFGDQLLKDEVLRHVKWHEEQDKIVSGAYWDYDFQRGCAVGCTIESIRLAKRIPNIQRDRHELYEEILGIPTWLARVEDGLFEGLDAELQRRFPREFLTAIIPGTNLDGLWPRMVSRIFHDPSCGVLVNPDVSAESREVAEYADGLIDQTITGFTVPESTWRNLSNTTIGPSQDARHQDDFISENAAKIVRYVAKSFLIDQDLDQERYPHFALQYHSEMVWQWDERKALRQAQRDILLDLIAKAPLATVL